ncbi:MAG: sulfite exporter TauE/SafE family protein [Bacteroidales bacterium]|nr:sulfite exporter TauE/SafE family protein [Bacteroidales bacterium]
MSLLTVTILILTGVLVGFINTLSAGGTIVSIALYLALGISPQGANAVNRVGVLLQDAFGSALFLKQGIFKVKQVLPYCFPVMAGALLGSLTAVSISEKVFSFCLGAILLVMIVFLFVQEKQSVKEEKHLSLKQYLIYFPVFVGIGFYGGFVQAGTGFLIIAALSMILGYDMIKTAAVKLFIMFLYTVVAITVFFAKGGVEVNYWLFGLIHSLGMIIGTWIADKYALKKGEKFIRWVIIFVILLTALNLFGIMDLQKIFKNLVL